MSKATFRWIDQVPPGTDVNVKCAELRFTTTDRECADHLFSQLSKNYNDGSSEVVFFLVDGNLDRDITIVIYRCDYSLSEFFQRYFDTVDFTRFTVTPLKLIPKTPINTPCEITTSNNNMPRVSLCPEILDDSLCQVSKEPCTGVLLETSDPRCADHVLRALASVDNKNTADRMAVNASMRCNLDQTTFSIILSSSDETTVDLVEKCFADTYFNDVKVTRLIPRYGSVNFKQSIDGGIFDRVRDAMTKGAVSEIRNVTFEPEYLSSGAFTRYICGVIDFTNPLSSSEINEVLAAAGIRYSIEPTKNWNLRFQRSFGQVPLWDLDVKDDRDPSDFLNESSDVNVTESKDGEDRQHNDDAASDSSLDEDISDMWDWTSLVAEDLKVQFHITASLLVILVLSLFSMKLGACVRNGMF